jgi:GntR family transcriptional regulator/MocR family aminotransferase
MQSVAAAGGQTRALIHSACRHASLAIVTPSRHYPLGFSMPLARRLDLLDWAGRHEAFIVEDDFDSEYRYRGTPLPAMMGLRSQAG